ncbi:hypothetical protein [Methylobacterium platani]|uniref:hypothetical protein n=1 Tax=Methylobacterium platani TaxID=427683 RepID=UPI0012E15B86|nr:hypothetical protein [Methylobacterium platani]
MFFIAMAAFGTGMAAGAWLIGESLTAIAAGMGLAGTISGLGARLLLTIATRECQSLKDDGQEEAISVCQFFPFARSMLPPLGRFEYRPRDLTR